jgi:hypothetical protein
VFNNPLTYLTLVFVNAGLGIADNGILIVKGAFQALSMEKEREMLKIKQMKAKKDKAVIHRRVTKMECKSYYN